jgi:hypothetical protein
MVRSADPTNWRQHQMVRSADPTSNYSKWARQESNLRLRCFKPLLYRLSYRPDSAVRTGVEPVAFRLTTGCSILLS